MLYLLSPAKSLDYDTPTPAALEALATEPPFPARSAELIRILKRKSAADIARLMSLSDPLAELNAGRYAHWSRRATPANSKPAALAFDGDVYAGLDAPSLAADDWAWAQRHLVILSGLYGALRPLDRLQPYRLEMGTRLRGAHGTDLYAHWGDAIAAHLNERAAADASPVIVNLASQEYFRAVRRGALRPRVVDCVFEDWSRDAYRVVGFFAKRARGAMARHAIRERIVTPAGLKTFATDGYRFEPKASTAERMVFRRRAD